MILFDYPYFESGGFGGGFFHKISNLIFGNNLLLYLCFYIFLNIYFSNFKNSFNNYLIYITLILFNLQFTIYNKYFDPLLLILIFLIFEFDIEKHIFKNMNQLITVFSEKNITNEQAEDLWNIGVDSIFSDDPREILFKF